MKRGYSVAWKVVIGLLIFGIKTLLKCFCNAFIILKLKNICSGNLGYSTVFLVLDCSFFLYTAFMGVWMQCMYTKWSIKPYLLLSVWIFNCKGSKILIIQNFQLESNISMSRNTGFITSEFSSRKKITFGEAKCIFSYSLKSYEII